jgi:hypothetical protein
MTKNIKVTPELYRQVFEVNKNGEAILDALERKFNQGAVTSGGIDAVLQTYERLGCVKVLKYITAMINQANNLEPTDLEAEFSTTESKP